MEALVEAAVHQGAREPAGLPPEELPETRGIALPTAELLALGGGIAAAAGDERDTQILGAIAGAVERRDLALERWARVVARRQELPTPGAG
jgi:hypothetical protein